MVWVELYESGALIPLSAYKYVHEYCPREVKWILFQDDDTIITEQNFQKIPASSQTTCLAKKYSGSKVIRTDSPKISEYEVKFFIGRFSILNFYLAGTLFGQLERIWTRRISNLLWGTLCASVQVWSRRNLWRIGYRLNCLIRVHDRLTPDPCSWLDTCFRLSSYPAKVASVTHPGNFTMEDVLFTGIMRAKANLSEPDDVRGVCKHYNSANKQTEVRNWLIFREDTTENFRSEIHRFLKPWKDQKC